ncbi:MAG: reductive dehalogenase domain-containing protein [Pseudomonadota bacterium]
MSWPANSARRPGDEDAGIHVTDAFERFRQRDDVFTRAFWDDTVKSRSTEAFFKSYRMEAAPRRGDGFTQRDFALRNASWLISDLISERAGAEGRREGFQAAIGYDTPVAPERVEVEDPSVQAREIKRLARFFGADLCGITDFDERWTYAARVDVRDFSEAPNDLPEATSVIVLGHQMEAALVDTYPSALAGAATGREYSHEAAIVMQLAAYIRNLGYEAVPSMNDTGAVIPYALKAGLGEYARNQLVITPEFGPRLRFSKIYTNLPLAHDAPRRLGVAKVCDICTRCASACPAKALPFGPPEQAEGRSVQKGVIKWTSDAEACFGYWAKLASDCAICLRVCPFNRDFSRLRNRLWLKLALSRLRRLALWLDDKSGRAARAKPKDWWAAIRR